MAGNNDNTVPPTTGGDEPVPNANTTTTTYPDEKRSASVTSGQRNVTMIEMSDKDKDGAIATDKEAEYLPSPEEQIEALGIADWRALEKKIVRRLDFTLMPCLWILYLFNYLDRASIAQARLSSLDQDLGLVGSQFSSAVAVLSAGYVLGQIPSNMLIGYIRPSLYLCLMALVWSGVSAATCGVKNYEGLMAIRFFLGIVEAPLLPGAVYLMSCWYKRSEMAFRVAILYTGQTLAWCVAGLIAAAVFGTLEGKHGLAGWQWLFIVLAVTGSGLAMICLMVLPDYPHSKSGSAYRWFMAEDMLAIANARMAADRVSVAEAKGGPLRGLWMCVKDYKMWVIAAMNIGISAAYGFSNFYPAIVRGFGYSNVATLLMLCPPYLLAATGSLINAWHSDKTRDRGWHFAGPVFVGSLGFIICLATQNGGARYGASFIYVVGMYTANPLISSWTSNSLGRTPEKRAVGIALVNILGQAGNVIAPYFFDSGDEPRYQRAFLLMMVCGVIASLSALLLKWLLVRSNKKLFNRALEAGTPYQPYIT